MNSQIYDLYWQGGNYVTKEWTPKFFDDTLGVLDGKPCVLDYGCGMGYSYQRLLKQRVGRYIGADVSSAALQDARSKGLEAYMISEAGSVDLENALCDGAVCCEVFEHLWDPLAAAKEIHRVLKPGGVLVATVPNFGYFAWRLLALFRAQVPLEPETLENRYRGVHIRFFSKLMLTRLLYDAGFKSVKIYGWCGCSIWHFCRSIGPFGKPFNWIDSNFPALRMQFLAQAWPAVCAERLRAVAVK